MKAPWWMVDAREERGADGKLMLTFRPHRAWLAWLALRIVASRLWARLRGRP